MALGCVGTGTAESSSVSEFVRLTDGDHILENGSSMTLFAFDSEGSDEDGLRRPS
jgi:hypothetical protein